jgi:hypothetical protein
MFFGEFLFLSAGISPKQQLHFIYPYNCIQQLNILGRGCVAETERDWKEEEIESESKTYRCQIYYNLFLYCLALS